MTQTVMPIIGMSPGNSYFKNREVAYLLRETMRRYGRAAIMVLDEPATSTYVAMGYSFEKASKKARLQGNGLKNKTKSMLEYVGIDSSNVIIINWVDDIAQNPGYVQKFEQIMTLYHGSERFKGLVQETSRQVLCHNTKEFAPDQIEQATHYLLSEIAFLEFAPLYFSVDKIDYVYHKPWRVYEDYIAGIFDGEPKYNQDFILLEAPYETYLSLDEQDTSRRDLIKKRGILRCTYVPYVDGLLKLEQNGELSGVFVDVIRDFTNTHNIALQFSEQSGYGVIASRLNQGFVDVFCAPVRPTKSRKLQLFFSKPLAKSRVFGYMRVDSDYKELSLEQLQDCAIRVVVKENDIHHDLVQRYFPKARIVRLPQLAPIGQEIEYVLENRADIAFWEDILVEQFLLDRDIITNTLIQKGWGDKPVEIYDNCLALPRGEFELKDAIDEIIDKFNSK